MEEKNKNKIESNSAESFCMHGQVFVLPNPLVVLVIFQMAPCYLHGWRKLVVGWRHGSMVGQIDVWM
jgi:hypothetical protein